MSARTIQIGIATVVIQPHCVETHFPDGTVCRACPEDTPEYRRTARDLGYGDDTGRLCVGHELSHSILAEARGLPYSPTLWVVAHGIPGTQTHYEEETDVMALQLFCNGGPRPAGTLDWEKAVERLREVVG